VCVGGGGGGDHVVKAEGGCGAGVGVSARRVDSVGGGQNGRRSGQRVKRPKRHKSPVP